MDRKGELPRYTNASVLKDAVNIPNGGYTTMRFKADNPGTRS